MKRQRSFYIFYFLMAIATGFYLSHKPWLLYLDQRSQADRAISVMLKIEQERVELAQKYAYFESPLGREELARNKGYRKPEEALLNLH